MSRPKRKPMFDPNPGNTGMSTDSFEELVKKIVVGDCTCKRRVVLAGFPVIRGEVQIHQHVATTTNPDCPIHGRKID